MTDTFLTSLSDAEVGMLHNMLWEAVEDAACKKTANCVVVRLFLQTGIEQMKRRIRRSVVPSSIPVLC